VKRHSMRLSDGRELIFFDDRDDTVRDCVDRRELASATSASELRYDPLTGEWIAYAADRQNRTFPPAADECPLCPSDAHRDSEIPAAEYDVVVFENRFPSFSGSPAAPPSAVTPWHLTQPGAGRCEVVCFTSEHHSRFADLTPVRVRLVIAALIDRTQELAAIPGVEQVFCFENRGAEIGVTLSHPHGQIYAYPFVTPDPFGADQRRAPLAYARRQSVRRPSNRGTRSGQRVVAANDYWTAFVPPAARWPVEVFIAPHRTVPDLPALTDDEVEAFGLIYLDLLRRFDNLFGVEMPYVAAWHQAPVRIGRDLHHLYMQLFSTRRSAGKLKYLAGPEAAMGAFINDIMPEDAARMLRDAATTAL
jgi:UDPglucose--hexose-1-phosphate uridylyltransferase